MESPGVKSETSMLAVIPARGGSKSIPRKNIKDFLGKPLLAWTIQSAQESGVFGQVVLSTDDAEIARVGQALGANVPFLRPAELAQDATPTAPVIGHAVKWMQTHAGWTPDWVVVLEPTSPGRRAFHIREAVALLQQSDADTVVSVSAVPHHYVPAKLLKLGDDGTVSGIGGTHPRAMIHRRQDLPAYYAFDGLIFACKTELVLQDPPTLWGDKVLAYVVDRKYSLDLDQPEDWVAAEARLRQVLLEEEG